MKFMNVDDIDVCYRVAGVGPPLVLIMGLTANMDWWDPDLIDALAERFEVLVFDNRGAGRTVAPEDGDFSCEQFADDTAGLMDALGIQHAHVLGMSMGGMIAQEFALRHPEKLDRLVLCCTFPGGANTVHADREVFKILMDRSGTPEELFERTLTIMFPSAWLETHGEYVEGFKERFLRAPASDHNAVRQFMATVSFDAYDRLPEICAPTLIACGDSDVLIPPVNSRTIGERIPGSRLAEYPGAGHAFINQAREEFLADLLDFLEAG
ncbi:MAG: alpha/beta hydrolase [Actinobacteria bacterium]|nr:alpha/beta hydrolase [Actinomycetota bacterium]MBU1942990.1 alpha/beta hydrolase [Actinomycetota bacterium]MBU2687770.1 alpha/beta hydrolase [Actinomycetota bacterium]